MRNRPPIISIVTPTFNQGNFIRDTIESVIRQSGNFLVDFIVVDGASTDQTVDILKEFEAFIKAKPIVSTIDGMDFYSLESSKGISFRWLSEKDSGQTHAINKGIRLIHRESRYFNWLCSDDTYRSDSSLSVLLRSSFPRSVVYGQSMYITESAADLKLYSSASISLESAFSVFGVPQPSALVHFDSKEDLLLDERYTSIMDLWLWIHLLEKGYRFVYLEDELISSYRIHTDSKTSSWRTRTYRELIQLHTEKKKPISENLIAGLYQECILGGTGVLGRMLRMFHASIRDEVMIRLLSRLSRMGANPLISAILQEARSPWKP